MAFSMYANKEPTKVRRRTVSRASSRRSRADSTQSKSVHPGQSSASESEGEGRNTRTSDLDVQGIEITDEKAFDTDLEPEETPATYDHSGRTTYLEECKKLGVIPASYFLRHMQPEDGVLDMKHHGLGASGMGALSPALMANTRILRLDLSDNWLGFDGGLALCSMIKENCFITDLTLSDNRLNSCAPELCRTLTMNDTLKRVTLSGNKFDDNAAEYFAEYINLNRRVEYLNLSHNLLCEAAGVLLGPAVSDNSILKELDLSWNHLRMKGAVAIAVGLKSNVMLKRLNISWNGFGVDGAIALGDALKGNSVLEELNISNNRIMAEGAVVIGKGLAENETLKVLRMAKNPMQSAGCWGICAAILRNPGCVLEVLDFEDVLVNKDFEEIFKQVKKQLPNLKCRHGGTEPPLKPKARIHPMVRLLAYIDNNNLRIVDFFNKFDKDGSMSVTREEFVEGLVEIGINLNEEDVELLLSELDRDGDGEINYSELAIGHQDFQDRANRLSLLRPMTS